MSLTANETWSLACVICMVEIARCELERKVKLLIVILKGNFYYKTGNESLYLVMYREQTLKNIDSCHFHHHDIRIQLHFNVFSYDSIDLALFAFLFWQGTWDLSRKEQVVGMHVFLKKHVFSFPHWDQHVCSCFSLQRHHYLAFCLGVKMLRIVGYVATNRASHTDFHVYYTLGGKAYNS